MNSTTDKVATGSGNWLQRFVLLAILAAAAVLGIAPEARAAAPCCGITRIDVKSQLVTAKENGTGRTFTFKVSDVRLLNSLKAGQGVYANFGTKLVSIDGKSSCCSMVSVSVAPVAAQIGSSAKPATPCCNITSIDLNTAAVTARETATGKTFQFKVGNSTLLKSLNTGQGVYANFATQQVSVDGIAPCCTIVGQVSAGGGTGVATSVAAAKAVGQVNPITPCCGITSVNAETGMVAARDNATGRIFSFKVTDANLLKSLQVGQGVYANFATNQVSVDNAAPCCTIVSQAQPASAPGAVAPVVSRAAGQVNPAPPCCAITGVNAETGTVAARENATGGLFSFRVTNANLLPSLKVGQGIYANFAAKQVSVDNLSPCCGIVSGPTALLAPTPQSGPVPSSGSASSSGGSGSNNSGKSNKVQTQSKSSKDLGTGNTEIKANEATIGQAIRGATAGNPPPAGNTGPGKSIPTLAGAAQTATPQTRPVPTLPVFSRERMQVRIISQSRKWRLQTFTGVVGGQQVKEEALYHLVGTEGISESPLPPQIKNELLKDAASSRGNDTVYIVHKSSAERIAMQLANLGSGSAPPRNSVTPTASSDNGCHDAFGWGNHLTQTASINFNTPGDLLMLSLSDQNLGPVNASGHLNIQAPASGHVVGEVELGILDFACAPVAVKLRHLRLYGTIDLGASLDLDAHLGADHRFKKRLVSAPLGGFGFFIGPIPVYVGFDAFLEGRVDVKVPDLVQVKYSAQGNGHGTLDTTCTMNGCSSNSSGSFTWSTSGDLTLLANGLHAIVKPGVLGGVEGYLYDPDIVNAHAGVEPYAKGDLWAYSGTGCSKEGAGAARDYTKALTADVDGGFDVVAGIDASGLAPNGFFSGALDQEFVLYNWERHLKFYDLIGSTALAPVVDANSPANAQQPKTITVQMRACYPYSKDKDGNPVVMTYQVGWGDATPDSQAQAAVGSGANPSHAWNSTGQFTIQARPLRDSHGRELPAQITQATLLVNGAAAAGGSVPGQLRGNGSRLVAQPTVVPNLLGENLQTIGANLVASTNPNHLPDLVPATAGGLASCSYDPNQSCQQQCPPYTANIPLGVKNIAPYGISGPIRVILQDLSGQTVRSWSVDSLAPSGQAYPGSFSYQAQFACPAPGTSTVSVGSAPAPNHVLVVMPPNGETEFQTNNNSAQIYIPADATISP